MVRHFRALGLAGLATLALSAPLNAHPHVFIDSRSELIFVEGSTLQAVRHSWIFDEAFSAFAVQGLDEDQDGVYTREELKELSDVNVESLAEFDFFTFLDLGETPLDFKEPVNHSLDHDGARLTLNFTLPLKDPTDLKGRTAVLQIFDPTIFVAFFMEKEQAATVVGDSTDCRSVHKGAEDRDIDAGTNFTDDFLASLDAVDEFAAQFAEKISISCG